MKRSCAGSQRAGQSSSVIGWRVVFHSSPQRGTRQAGFGSDNPIHVATSANADVVHALVAAGFNPRYGQVALVSAVEAQDSDTVHVLVEAGVDVNCQPGANTPLVAAIEARNVTLMTYVEAHGAREKP